MDNKPRIIILMHYLELGGAEMALIGLLHALDPDRVDVDLFIYSHQGPLMQFIPKWVNLLPEVGAYSVIEKPIVEAIKHGQFGVAIGRLIAKLKHKEYLRNNRIKGDDASAFSFIGKYLTPFLPAISKSEEYDLCISFLLPHDYGLHKVNAKKRIAWIHSDYSNMHVNHAIELPVWAAYDHIASISEAATQSFLKVFPTLSDRVIEIENIMSPEFVRTRADEADVSRMMQGTPTLLSIGRYSYAKNYDNVPEITKFLVRDFGFTDLKWYIIGYGDDTLIKTKIEEFGMTNYVILLGKKENPYPYIKACDVYVQPSRYEGKSVTVREAQILGKPVIVTDYPTARSQVKDGYDGVIVPLTNRVCAEGIASLLSDSSRFNILRENVMGTDFGNLSEVEKIYKVLGND